MFAFQLRLRNPLPQVLRHKDYQIKARLYEHIDDILTRCGLDTRFIEYSLQHRDQLRQQYLADKRGCDPRDLDDMDLTANDFLRSRFIEHSLVAFRCNIIRFLEGNDSTRRLSNRLTDTSAGFPAKILTG